MQEEDGSDGSREVQLGANIGSISLGTLKLFP